MFYGAKENESHSIFCSDNFEIAAAIGEPLEYNLVHNQCIFVRIKVVYFALFSVKTPQSKISFPTTNETPQPN